MLEKIYDFINKYHMLSKGDTVVCGLSGGADSVCLLIALYNMREKLGINVEAIHVNHRLRGNESERDEQFCRDLCCKLNITLFAESCNVKEFAETHSVSIEEAARKLRYDIFNKYSCGKKLATAHNANDNLETVILNLTRGSALKGLTGIPPLRNNIIRPLLNVSRSEIEAFLLECGQDFITDSTNLSDDYTRNKIRHRVIPFLEELNPSLIETSTKSADAMRSENSFIEQETDKALSVCRQENALYGLTKYHAVIRRRCIARLLSDNSLPYSYDRLEAADILALEGGKMNIAGNLYLVSDKNKLSIEKISNKSAHTTISKELIIGENYIFPDRSLVCEMNLCDNLKKINDVHKNLTIYTLDYDKIIGRAVVRNRRYGDRIQLCGRNFTSSVKKLINETVPANLRKHLHFIEDEQGTVFAENIGIAERVKPDADTVNFLTIFIKHI